MDATTENIDHLSKVSEISCDVEAENCHRLSYANLSGIFLCNYVSHPNSMGARGPCWHHLEPPAHLNKLWKPCAPGDKGSTNMPGRQLLYVWNNRRLFSKREWLDWLSLGSCGRIHGLSYRVVQTFRPCHWVGLLFEVDQLRCYRSVAWMWFTFSYVDSYRTLKIREPAFPMDALEMSFTNLFSLIASQPLFLLTLGLI